MNLDPRTGVPEVNSYFDKGPVCVGRPCCAGGVDGICDFPANVLALVHADVCYDHILLAMIVRRCAAGVPHGRDAAEIGDALRVRIYRVKRKWSCVGRARKELVVKPISWQRRLIWQSRRR